jgi:beta-N-acetylhexosaminidase
MRLCLAGILSGLVVAVWAYCATPAWAEAVGPDDTPPSTVPATPAPQSAAPDAPAAPAADLRTMVGQMLIVGFLGTSPQGRWVRTVRAQLDSGALGGVFFLGRNITSRAQVTELTGFFAAAAAAAPPFIAVDQEGGFVQRLSSGEGFSLIPSAIRMAELHGADAAPGIYAQAAAELASAGFNVNFSPVVDLNINPSNPIIGKVRRSYGTDPHVVAGFARILIDAHAGQGILTAIKHFPGHGSSTADSHEQLVDITRTWSDSELEPYRELVANGYQGMVMVGHLYNGALDGAGRRPATFSEVVIGGLLRGSIGFQGVVVTDDLEMGAIRRNYSLEDTIVSAIAAGNDILLFSQTEQSDVDRPERVYAIVEAAIASGRLTRDRIAQSYARVLALKARLRTR